MVVHSADSLPRAAATAAGRRSVSVAALGVGAVVAAAVLTPHDATTGPVVCPFRLLTGLPCPGCGLTRSWVYWLHGDWQAGLAANPFGIVLLVAAVSFAVATARALVTSRPVPSIDELVRRRSVALVAGAWLAFAVVRMILVATGHLAA